MTVNNTIIHHNLDFHEYLKLPGYSFSSLRPSKIENVTEKMKIGTYVDAYLFTPEKYHGERYDLVQPIVLELKKVFGNSLSYGDSQLSVTSEFSVDGLTLDYKGRPDFKIGKLIVDLKVSELDVRKAIEFFRYDWQLSGYTFALECEKAMIISIHPKTKKISPAMIDLKMDWWEWQIKQNGTVKNVA